MATSATAGSAALLTVLLAACTGVPQSGNPATTETSATQPEDVAETERIDFDAWTGEIWIEAPTELVPSEESAPDLYLVRGGTAVIFGVDCGTPYVLLDKSKESRDPKNLGYLERVLESQRIEDDTVRDLSLNIPPDLGLGRYTLWATCSWIPDSPDDLASIEVEVVDRPNLVVDPQLDLFPMTVCLPIDETTNACRIETG